jgi:hypothetical protein
MINQVYFGMKFYRNIVANFIAVIFQNYNLLSFHQTFKKNLSQNLAFVMHISIAAEAIV